MEVPFQDEKKLRTRNKHSFMPLFDINDLKLSLVLAIKITINFTCDNLRC